jgi:hypothetical protein
VIIKYSSWGLLGVLGACAALNILIYIRIAFLQCKKVTTRKCNQWRAEKRKREIVQIENFIVNNNVAEKQPEVSSD